MIEDHLSEKLVITREDLPPAMPEHPDSDTDGPRREAERTAVDVMVAAFVSLPGAGLLAAPIAAVRALASLVKLTGRRPRRAAVLAGVSLVVAVLSLLMWIALAWWCVTRLSDAAQGRRQRDPLPVGGEADLTAIDRAPEHIRRAIRASVSLTCERRSTAGWLPSSAGTGTVVATSGKNLLIVTCRHVVNEVGADSSTWRIRARWPGGEFAAAQVAWKAEALDLAVVVAEVPAEGALSWVAIVGDSSTAKVGEEVFAVGDPLSFRSSLIKGVVSAVRTFGDGGEKARYIQSQLPLNPGNSGGGLFDAQGRLIGVNTWTLPKSTAEGVGFSVAIEALWAVLSGAPEEIRTPLLQLAAPPAVGQTRSLAEQSTEGAE